MQRFHALTGNLPPRRSAWRAPGARADAPSQAFARQLERVRAAPKIPEWERIFQEMQLAAERVVAADPGHRRGRPRSSTPGSTRCSRSAAGCARGARGECTMRHRRRRLGAGGAGAAVIAVFFALPVVAGLALSLTDFDLYALADLSTLRFVGLDNYLRLLQTPLFWQALGNTLYFVAVGVPVSIGLSLGAALLLDSRFARWQRVLPHRAVRAGRHDRRRRGGHLALPAAHALRARSTRALEAIGIDADRLARRPALVDAGDHPVRRLEELRLQHDHPARRAAGGAARALRGGARRRRRRDARSFTDLTLPMLTPTLVMVGILTVSGYFQLFAEPYVMTQGGPLRSTFSVLYFMYEEGFRWWNLGNASAVAFLLFIVIFACQLGAAALRPRRARGGR